MPPHERVRDLDHLADSDSPAATRWRQAGFLAEGSRREALVLPERRRRAHESFRRYIRQGTRLDIDPGVIAVVGRWRHLRPDVFCLGRRRVDVLEPGVVLDDDRIISPQHVAGADRASSVAEALPGAHAFVRPVWVLV